MDGRVGAIRRALDEDGLRRRRRSWPTPRSSPPPSTARSARRPTRRRRSATAARYQMDPANGREALREVAARHRRGRRHGHGQARAAVPRRRPAGERTRRGVPVAAYNVSGEYAMVKAAAAAGLPRRARRRPRGADLDPPRGRGHRHHLPRQGRRAMASVTPKLRSRKRRRGDPARRLRQAPAQRDAGRLPASSRGPTPRSPGALGVPEERVLKRVQELHRPPHHPPGHPDLRHARARLRLDARRRQGRPRAPVAGGEDRQLAPGREPQLPAQPRLQHVVHDRGRGGLEARPAGHPGPPAGAHRRGVDPPASDAQALQDPHGPRARGRDRRPGPGRGRRGAGRARAPALRRVRPRRHPCHPGRPAGVAEPYVARRAASSGSASTRSSSTSAA